MLARSARSLLAILVCAPALAQSSAAQTVTVPALTPVYLRIDAELSSKKSRIGDRFPVHIDEDVRIGDAVVIPAGSAGEGEVIHAAKSGAGGKAGELLITARFVRVGDQEVKLRSFSLGGAGRDRTNESLATSFALGPLALFVVGGVVTIPAGTVAGAKTAVELQLPAVAPTRPTAEPQPVDSTRQEGELDENKATEHRHRNGGHGSADAHRRKLAGQRRGACRVRGRRRHGHGDFLP